MRRWAVVSTFRQIGTRRPNRRRRMRSISASVGKGWQQQFYQRCGAGLRPALLTGEACRSASCFWCSAIVRIDPDQRPLGPLNRCHSFTRFNYPSLKAVMPKKQTMARFSQQPKFSKHATMVLRQPRF
jgi:hypothetical protein